MLRDNGPIGVGAYDANMRAFSFDKCCGRSVHAGEMPGIWEAEAAASLAVVGALRSPQVRASLDHYQSIFRLQV